MKFDLPKELASIIKVIGVGGGGSNAVNHMYEQGIQGVDFIICNTDRQALDVSPVPVKLQLGLTLTEGLGAGSIPERGNQAAQENLDEIRQLLGARTKMVFITAGMGGGTGTGAGPVIAAIARELGILTVGIVTMPFQWEGRKRKLQAAAGIDELRKAVDTLLVINNDRLRDLFGNLSLDNAFEHADNVLTTAARGIAEIITKTGKVNVDFEDVKTVMTSSGVAIMGMAEAEGEDRSLRAAQEALASPLLNDNDIKGAKYVLLNITYGSREVLMDEISEITDHIQGAAGSSADVIWGYGRDESLGDKVRITVIATGFATHPDTGVITSERNTRTVIPLDADRPTMITQPIVNPVMASAPAAPVAPPAVAEPEHLEMYIKPVEPKPEPVAVVEPKPALLFEPEQPVLRAVPEPKVEEVVNDKVVYTLYDAAEAPAATTPVSTPVGNTPRVDTPRTEVTEARLTPNEHQARVEERVAKVREMSQRLRTPNGLSDLEREPAYKRKNIQLNDAAHSSDSTVSRYTLSEETDENGDRRVELKRNNPYLHDNVD
ncbi:MAG: cell division protein FtsZ [Flavobacteriales bacterium]